ncbi:ArsR family transcriptional regulator [Pseudarthrobacter sp. J1738]|uniref:ArsR family transcriptional regulator n=1 Tax=Pseudarthrobacter sp. J1738 TaxID=3420446 RepID=UPI003D2E6E71
MQQDLNTRALQTLRRAGVRISGGGLDALALILPDSSTLIVRMKSYPVAPTPSAVENLVASHKSKLLIATPRPTKSLVQAAHSGQVDLVGLSPESLIIDGTELLLPQTGDTTLDPAAAQGKPAWGRYALIRSLLTATNPLKQRELAELCGTSQPAVVKNLKHLGNLVERTSQGWSSLDRERLLDLFLQTYPGPGGAVTYWYGLGSVHEQSRRASDFAAEVSANPLASGDVAADVYAPWRLPSTATMYVSQMVDLGEAGFSPATKSEATFLSVIPEDQSLWRTASPTIHDGFRLADPLLTLWELAQATAPDSPDAVEHLQRAILAGATQ